MADAPSNLGFEDPGGAPGTAEAWLLLEAPQAREYAAFATRAYPPATDPYFTGWTPVGASLPTSLVPPPYGAGGPAAVEVDDDGSSGMHGAESPDAVELLPGRTYTASVYAYGNTARAALYVQVAAAGALVAVLDCARRLATFAGRAGAAPPGTDVVAHLSAGASRVAGNIWTRLWLSFSVATGATEPGLAAAAVRVLSCADDAGDVEYAGPAAESPTLWGFALYEEPLTPAEGFEDAWGAGYASSLSGEVAAVFPAADPGGATWDGFDRWVVPYLYELGGSAATAAWGGTEPAEGFEGGWANDVYLYALSSPTAATFAGGAAEDFEGGWANDVYLYALSGEVGAVFAGDLADAAEDFERAYDDAEYSVEVALNRLLVAAQPFVADVRVSPVNDGGVPGSAFPAPLAAQVYYYVVSPNPTYLQVSLTQGGAAVDLTTAGSGVQVLRADARRYWAGPDHNPTI